MARRTPDAARQIIYLVTLANRIGFGYMDTRAITTRGNIHQHSFAQHSAMDCLAGAERCDYFSARPALATADHRPGCADKISKAPRNSSGRTSSKFYHA